MCIIIEKKLNNLMKICKIGKQNTVQETQINFIVLNMFICSKSTMTALVQHVNMFQVLNMKLDTKLK